MSERYNVVRKADDMVVNTILLDGPAEETEEFRYVLAVHTGIGWTLPVSGLPSPPPAPTAPPVVMDVAALLAELDSLKARLQVLDNPEAS